MPGDTYAGTWKTDTHALGLATRKPRTATLYHDAGRVVALHQGHDDHESDTDMYPLLSIREQLAVTDALTRFLSTPRKE